MNSHFHSTKVILSIAVFFCSWFAISDVLPSDLVFEKTFTVNETGKLSHLESVDASHSTRRSKEKLQMVSKNFLQARTAIITAYKDDPSLDWNEGEPKWSGIVSATGVDSVTFDGTSGGEQRAEADGLERSVIIEIIDGKEQQITIGVNSFAEFQKILVKVTEMLGGDKDNLTSTINGSWKWYKVDQIESPLCQTTYEFSAYGKFAYCSPKFYIPSLSIILPCVKVGIFVRPCLSINVTGIDIKRDGALNPIEFSELSGGAGLKGSVSGGGSAEIKDPWNVVSVKTDLKGTAAAGGEFNLSVPGPILGGEYYIGKVTVSGQIEIKYLDNPFVNYEVLKPVWDGLKGAAAVDLSSFFSGK